MNLKMVAMICFVGLMMGPVHAAVTYQLEFRSSEVDMEPGGTIFATPGQVFSGVQVVLAETVSGGSESYFAASNIAGYSADLSVSGGDGAFRNLSLNTEGGFAAGRNGESTLNFASFGPALGQTGRESSVVSDGRREALLGIVDLVAPTSGSSMFSVFDSKPEVDGDFGTFLTSAGLESLSVESGGGFFGGSVSVTAVPEPGSMLALSVFAVGGIVYRRRRMARSAN